MATWFGSCWHKRGFVAGLPYSILGNDLGIDYYVPQYRLDSRSHELVTMPPTNQTIPCPVCLRDLRDELLTCIHPLCPRLNPQLNAQAIQQLSTQIPIGTTPSPPRLINEPPVIPGYSITKLIGQGGMGTVYEGVQISLKRRVAIKVLDPNLANQPGFAARFEMEAEALARLTHPNIVSIYDRGRSGDVLFFVMEYVESGKAKGAVDLRQIMDQGLPSIEITQKLMVLIARALHHAHHQGIIHRDIKPSNILMDQHGQPKVTDFGIATMQQSNAQQLTVSGSAMGTLGYMAPEQHRDASRVDHRADIYSLGVMLYELLTGEKPLGAFLPPSQVRSGLPSVWDGITMRALQPKPENRFSDMSAFADAIERLSSISNQVNAASIQVDDDPTIPCPECVGPTTLQDRYCGRCGLDLVQICPKCKTNSRAGTTFCPKCGEDVPRRLRFLKLIETARNHRDVAIAKGELHTRAAAAESCCFSSEDALRLDPNASEPIELIAEAKPIAIKILKTLLTHADKGNELSMVEALAMRIIELDPSQSTIEVRLVQIRKGRADRIAEIRKVIDSGNAIQAKKLVEKLKETFPAHPEILLLTQEIEGDAEALNRFVQTEYPELKSRREYRGIRLSLDRLESRGIRHEKLSKLSLQVDQILREASSRFAKAQASLTEGKYADARALSQEVLDSVGDFTEAQLLIEECRSRSRERSSNLKQAKEAFDQGRWYLARKCLDADPSLLEVETVISLRKKIEFKISHVENARRLRVWVWLSAVVWLLVAAITFLSVEKLATRIFPLSVSGFTVNKESGSLGLLLFWLPFLGSLSATKLASLMRPSSAFKGMTSKLIIFAPVLLAAVILTCLFDSGELWKLISLPSSWRGNATGKVVDIVTQLLIISAFGWYIGWLCTELVYRLLDTGKDDIPPHGMGFLLATFSIGIVVVASNRTIVAPHYLFPLTLGMIGLSGIFGLSNRWQRYPAFIVIGLLIAGVMELLEKDLKEVSRDWIGIGIGLILGLSLNFLGSKKSILGILIALGLAYSLQQLGEQEVIIYPMLIWWFLVGMTFGDFHDLIDRTSHRKDR
jgi:serine/threonine protein kinase